MLSIHAPAAAAPLDRIARERSLLVLDFDGTLAPYVADRDAAAVPAATRALLRATALLYPCAVVSGRTRRDVAARLDGVPLAAVIGNHGAEPGFGPVDPALRARVRSWLPALRAAVAARPGLDLEDKLHGVALHFRAAPELAEDAGRIAAGVPGARIVRGRDVVNLVPEEGRTKGEAVVALRRRLGLDFAVYVGDDESDEDVFRSGAAAIGVRVAPGEDSAADLFLRRQEEIDDLLGALVSRRAQADGRDPGWERLVRALG